MMGHLKNERGLTLVELLAVFVILGIVSSLAYSVLMNGFKAYDRIEIESKLRDEADIIMAELISELYTLKESEINNKRLPEGDSNNYYFELTDGNKVGFYEGKVLLKSKQTSSLQTGEIKLSEESKIVVKDAKKGLYKILLTVVYNDDDRKQTLMTESEISTIKD